MTTFNAVSLSIIVGAIVAGMFAMRRHVSLHIGVAFVRHEPGRALLGLFAVALATAIITVAAFMSDSVNASIADRAANQQGPVDSLVIARTPAARGTLDAIESKAGLDATSSLHLKSTTTSVAANGFLPFDEPRAQLVEVDFDAARRFGGTDTSGLVGANPGPDEAVANTDLAFTLNLSLGSHVLVHLYGTTLKLRISAIVVNHGIAGLLAIDGPASSRSPDLFVAPGTFDRTWTSASAPGPGAGPSSATAPIAVLAIHNSPGRQLDPTRFIGVGSDVEVRSVALENAAEADRQSDRLRSAMRPHLIVGVVTGLALLCLIVAIGTGRRRRAFAELRAMGLDRGGLLSVVGVESAIDSVAGAITGVALGTILAAIGVAAAQKVYSPENAEAVLLLRFSPSPQSMVSCFAIGSLVGLVAGATTGAGALRGPVAPALADEPRRMARGLTRFTRIVGRSLTAELALAYSRARPVRTVVLILMFAISVCGTTTLFALSRSQDDAAIAAISDLGGGAGVLVTTNAANPLSADHAAAVPNVGWAVAASSRTGRVAPFDSPEARLPVTIIGPGHEFADHNPPPLASTDGALGDDAAWRTALNDPSTVIVGADLAVDAAGLGGRRVRAGETVVVSDEVNNRKVNVRVVGVVRQAQYAGADHLYGARELVDQLTGSKNPANMIFVGGGPEVDTNRLASTFLREHPTEVTDAVSFDAIVGDRNRSRIEFLRLLIGYSVISLLAGVISAGVTSAASVRDRRRDFAVLRALGAQDYRIRQILRVEATGITLFGTILGVIGGLGIARALLANTLGGGAVALVTPWVSIVALTVFAVASARSAVWIATTVNLGVQPAAAMTT